MVSTIPTFFQKTVGLGEGVGKGVEKLIARNQESTKH